MHLAKANTDCLCEMQETRWPPSLGRPVYFFKDLFMIQASVEEPRSEVGERGGQDREKSLSRDARSTKYAHKTIGTDIVLFNESSILGSICSAMLITIKMILAHNWYSLNQIWKI